jgi:hypothetical protein
MVNGASLPDEDIKGVFKLQTGSNDSPQKAPEIFFRLNGK